MSILDENLTIVKLKKNAELVIDLNKGLIIVKNIINKKVVRLPYDQELNKILISLKDTGIPKSYLVSNLLNINSTKIPNPYYFLKLLEKNLLIEYAVNYENCSFFQIVPLSENFSLKGNKIDSEFKNSKYSFSQYTYFHFDGIDLVFASPISLCELKLKSKNLFDPIFDLIEPFSYEIFISKFILVPEPITKMFFRCLFDFEFICSQKTDKQCEAKSIANWEFHDLLFHSKSREGRNESVYGSITKKESVFVRIPVTKPLMSTKTVELVKPEIQKLINNDKAFQEVLESRRSIRSYGRKPITINQISELLYRSSRIQKVVNNDLSNDISFRPYPSGGALHELEIYILSNKCDGLANGLYHYCPKLHQLELLNSNEVIFKKVLNEAKKSGACDEDIQILIVVTARFQRVSSKYNSLAYRLVLLNTGALMQNFYLAAIAMELSPCQIGGGNSDLFAKLSGLDYYEEPAIAEFLIGSKNENATQHRI
jgi:SagB-type dehydrogenase family enzyme